MKKPFELPPLGGHPRNEELRKYDHNKNPLEHSNLEFVGKLPFPNSLSIESSIIGLGYETLDRDTFEPKLTYDKIVNSGVKWARLQSGWLKCEKEKGIYNFKWLDEIVDSLIAIGVQPWISVSFGNPLYTLVEGYDTYAEDHPGETVPSFVRGYVGENPIYHGDEALKAWRNYLRAMVRHFKGRVKHWEVWNEPNSAPHAFWRTYELYQDYERSDFEAACAADYVKFVRICAEAIRESDEHAQIIAGSLSLTLDACFYVRNLVKNGITKYIDIFTFHPYGVNPEFGLEERYNNIRYELDSHGGEHIRIWQGEVGYPTIKKDGFCSGSEYVQAKYITRRFTADFKLGCEVSSYFMVIDKQNYNLDGNSKVCGYGVLDCKGNPKLSYIALQSMGYLFDSAQRADDLYIRISVFGTPPTSSHLRPIAIQTNKFRSRNNIPVFSYHIPENPEISMEPGNINIQLWVDESDKLDDLVVIDPLRGNVYRIIDFETSSRGFKCPAKGFDETVKGFVTLTNMPFTDYPLFISDLSILESGEK